MDSDDQAIRTTLFNYFEGLKSADRARLEAAFAVDAGHMKGYVRNKEGKLTLSVRPMSEVIDGWVSRAPAPGMQGKILSLQIISPDSALASFDFNGVFIDTFQLARIDGQWKIVNKFYVDK